MFDSCVIRVILLLSTVQARVIKGLIVGAKS